VQAATAWPCLLAGEPTELFLSSWQRDRLSVFVPVSTATPDDFYFQLN
jgi:hypothetical protein